MVGLTRWLNPELIPTYLYSKLFLMQVTLASNIPLSATKNLPGSTHNSSSLPYSLQNYSNVYVILLPSSSKFNLVSSGLFGIPKPPPISMNSKSGNYFAISNILLIDFAYLSASNILLPIC